MCASQKLIFLYVPHPHPISLLLDWLKEFLNFSVLMVELSLPFMFSYILECSSIEILLLINLTSSVTTSSTYANTLNYCVCEKML